MSDSHVFTGKDDSRTADRKVHLSARVLTTEGQYDNAAHLNNKSKDRKKKRPCPIEIWVSVV